MSLDTWLGFLTAAIVIALAPGPGAAAAMSAGLVHGYRSALVLIFGLQAALFCQLGVVAAGLGALMAASNEAFEGLRFLGAAYLIWLGIQKWQASSSEGGMQDARARRGGLFMEGLLVNLSNPKAVVFMAALVPQFIDPALPGWPQYGIVAITLCGTDILVMSAYAGAAQRVGAWRAGTSLGRWANCMLAAVFVVAGIFFALVRPSRWVCHRERGSRVNQSVAPRRATAPEVWPA